MTQTAKYFYECDYCGIKKEIESNIREQDKIEREMLSSGWIFIREFHITTISKDKMHSHCSGSAGLNGEYCSLNCLLKAVRRAVLSRWRGD